MVVDSAVSVSLSVSKAFGAGPASGLFLMRDTLMKQCCRAKTIATIQRQVLICLNLRLLNAVKNQTQDLKLEFNNGN
jgi:hypothetical protein